MKDREGELGSEEAGRKYKAAWDKYGKGNLEKALELFRSIIPYYKEHGPLRNYAKSLKGMGLCEGRFRENKYSVYLLTLARDKFLEIGEKLEAAKTECNLSISLNRTRKYREALRLLAGTEKTLSGSKRKEDSTYLCYCYESKGVAYYNLRKYEESIEYFRKALECLAGQKSGMRACFLQEKIAWSLFRLGRHEEAVDLLNSCLEILKENKQERFQVHFHLGKNLEAKGEEDRALEEYKKAVEIFEEKLGQIRIDDYRESFQGDNQRVYTNLIELAIRKGLAEQAYVYAQSSKARVFSELLTGEHKIDFTKDPKLFARKMELLSRIEEMENRESGFGSDHRAGEELRRLRFKYEDCLREIKEKNPRTAGIIEFSPLKIPQIMGLLAHGEALVDYYFLNNGLAAFVFYRDKFNAVILSLKRKELKEIMRSTAGFLENGETESEGLDWYMQEVYSRLIEPLEEYIGDCRCLVICPHQGLHRFPFCLLRSKGRYLAEKHQIAYIPSPVVLKACRAKHRFKIITPRDCLVIADSGKDLRWAKEEAEKISDRFQKHKVLLEENAAIGNLSEHGPKYDIIHIACHGKFNSESPVLSYIQMCGPGGRNKKLSVADIFQLEIDNSQLVVLSSCETGLGKPTPGDEINCITRAFMYAGAPSVIVTLWEIDDESTSGLMSEFYRAMLDGKSKAEALQHAQVVTMRKYPGTPRFWSPFQLVGDWR